MKKGANHGGCPFRKTHQRDQSATGVMLSMQFLHSRPRHMRVNLRCRQITVSEQHLHDAQIRTIIQQVGRKCVTQRVRR